MSDAIHEPDASGADEAACRRRAVSGVICGIVGVALPLVLIGALAFDISTWDTESEGLSERTLWILMGGLPLGLVLGIAAVVQGIRARHEDETHGTATSALALGGVALVCVAGAAFVLYEYVQALAGMYAAAAAQ